MRIKRLNGMFTIGSQLDLIQVGNVAKQGYKSIICMRPDNEGGGQTDFNDIKLQAEREGMEAVYIPVSPRGETPENIEAFARAIDTLRMPILAYCRTGTRPATLWAKWEHAQSGGVPDGGESRTGGMRAGALDGGGMSIGGKRAGKKFGAKMAPIVDIDSRRDRTG